MKFIIGTKVLIHEDGKMCRYTIGRVTGVRSGGIKISHEVDCEYINQWYFKKRTGVYESYEYNMLFYSKYQTAKKLFTMKDYFSEDSDFADVVEEIISNRESLYGKLL